MRITLGSLRRLSSRILTEDSRPNVLAKNIVQKHIEELGKTGAQIVDVLTDPNSQGDALVLLKIEPDTEWAYLIEKEVITSTIEAAEFRRISGSSPGGRIPGLAAKMRGYQP